MKSRIERPNTNIAIDYLVSLLGVLRYCRVARFKESVSSSPFGPVLARITFEFVYANFISAIAKRNSNR